MLPLSLQPTDEKTHKIKHMAKHIELIMYLQTLTKGRIESEQLASIYARLDKLLIADTEDNISFRKMCEGKTGLLRGTALRKRTKGTFRAVLTPDNCLVPSPGSKMMPGMGILRMPRKHL